MAKHAVDDAQIVIDSVREIVRALETGSRAAQKKLGLSGAQLFVLQSLASDGPLSIGELATRSYTHQSSTSAVVKRLVEAGLVEQSRSGSDGRRTQLSLTAAGRAKLKHGFVTPQQRLRDGMNSLPSRKLAKLRSLLEQVLERSGVRPQRSS